MKRFLLIPLLFIVVSCSDDKAELEAKTPHPNLRQENDLLMAQRAEQEGDIDHAITLYKRVIAKGDATSEPYVHIAYLLRQKKRLSEAADMLGKAAEMEQDNTSLIAEYGMSLVAANRSQEAVGVFDAVIKKEPKMISGYNGKGVALDLLKDHKAAQNAYRAGLLAVPGTTSLTNNLALSLILTDKYSEAISLLEPLAEKAETRSTVRQRLALAYGLKGDHKKALAMGLKDLPEPKAKENVEFYKRYIVTRKEASPSQKAAPVTPVQEGKKAAATKPEPEMVKPDIVEEEKLSDEELSPYEDQAPAPVASEPKVMPQPEVKKIERKKEEEADDNDDGLFEAEQPATTPVPSYRHR